MLERLLANQAELIADYQAKALKTEDASKCNLWSLTLKELITGYFKLINKDKTVMALSQTDLDLVLAAIENNGDATAKIAELEDAIASKTAELEAFKAEDVVEDANYEAKIAEIEAALAADEAQLKAIKDKLIEVAAEDLPIDPVVEVPVVEEDTEIVG